MPNILRRMERKPRQLENVSQYKEKDKFKVLKKKKKNCFKF